MIELTVNGKQKPMNIVDVVHTMSAQLGTAAMYRKLNPIGAMYYALTRKTVNLTKFTKAVANNCRVTRDFLRSLIQQRKSEQMKSEVGGNADLLSLFLSSPDIFTDDDIIDELVDFLLAGTQTTAYAILTMLSHLAKSKESMQAVRAEFNKSASIPPTEGEGSETFDQKFATLMSSATLEYIQEQEYLSWVLNETLRHQSSIRQNTGVRCDHNMKLGGFNIRANDSLMINFQSLHHNPLEWQRPNEFLPRRFDPNSPLFLTPSG